MPQQEFATQRLDHLGVVAGLCREIDLSGQIDLLIAEGDAIREPSDAW